MFRILKSIISAARSTQLDEMHWSPSGWSDAAGPMDEDRYVPPPSAFERISRVVQASNDTDVEVAKRFVA